MVRQLVSYTSGFVHSLYCHLGYLFEQCGLKFWDTLYNKQDKSTYDNHLIENHHPKNSDSFIIIKIVNNKKLIELWENVEIFKAYKERNTW